MVAIVSVWCMVADRARISAARSRQCFESLLLTDETEQVTWLKSEINEHLMQKPLDVELLDDTARELRQTAISFRRREFEANLIHRAMGELRPDKLQRLLTEVADQISPSTAEEIVESDPFC
jgi:hypothetical protein